MKRCFLFSAVLKRDFRGVNPENLLPGFTVIVWLMQYTTPWICWHDYLFKTRQGKSFKGKFFSLCCGYQAKISQVIRSFFYMWEVSFTLVFTCLYLSVYLSIDLFRKFVFRFWAHRQRVAVVYVIVLTRKRELSQVKSQTFVCVGLGNFPQKIFAQRKCPDKLSLYQ